MSDEDRKPGQENKAAIIPRLRRYGTGVPVVRLGPIENHEAANDASRIIATVAHERWPVAYGVPPLCLVEADEKASKDTGIGRGKLAAIRESRTLIPGEVFLIRGRTDLLLVRVHAMDGDTVRFNPPREMATLQGGGRMQMTAVVERSKVWVEGRVTAVYDPGSATAEPVPEAPAGDWTQDEDRVSERKEAGLGIEQEEVAVRSETDERMKTVRLGDALHMQQELAGEARELGAILDEAGKVTTTGGPRSELWVGPEVSLDEMRTRREDCLRCARRLGAAIDRVKLGTEMEIAGESMSLAEAMELGRSTEEDVARLTRERDASARIVRTHVGTQIVERRGARTWTEIEPELKEARRVLRTLKSITARAAVNLEVKVKVRRELVQPDLVEHTVQW